MPVNNPWGDLFEHADDPGSIRIRDVPDGTRIVVASDFQIPLEDRELAATVFGPFAKAFKPDRRKYPSAEFHLFLNGDVMDNFRLSRFVKRVMPRFTMDDELAWTRKNLRAWGKHFTHRHYAFGNHEERWDKYIWENAPEMAYSMPRLAEVLQLRKLGYDWVPYLEHYDFMGFIITHGDRTVKHTAAAMMDVYHTSGTSGHTNRPQSFTFADAASGEPNTWYVSGMMCRKDIGKVIKDWRKVQPWQQAFLTGEVQDGILHVELVRVHHGAFWAAGKMFKVDS